MITKAHIKEIYLEKAQSLLFFATKFVNYQTAEDIVQDAFLKLWGNRKELSESKNINGYLFQMVKNSCLDNLKHQSVKNKANQELALQLKIDEAEFYTAETYSLENNTLEKIYKCIETLPEKCREIFVAAYLQNRRNKDIASDLNISVRTVDAQIYKALSILRENIYLLLLILLYSIARLL